MAKKNAEQGDNEAGDVAVQALGFLAREPERLGRFLSVTGLGPTNLRAAAREPYFLAQILDYLCADEALLMTFAEDSKLNPATVARARLRLSGPTIEGVN